MAALLLLLAPIVVAIILCTLHGRVGKRIATIKEQHPEIARAMAVVIILAAFGASVSNDMLDTSDVLFGTNAGSTQLISDLNYDLQNHFGLSGAVLQSTTNRINTIVNSIRPLRSKPAQLTLAGVTGFMTGLYILIAVYGASSETSTKATMNSLVSANQSLRQEKEIAENNFQAACEILKDIHTMIRTKHKRIVNHINQASQKGNIDYETIKKALSPSEQLQSMVECAHLFLDERTPGVTMRVALFIHDKNNNSLQVVASTNGGQTTNVCQTPSKPEFQHHFDTSKTPPGSVAVRAFQSGNIEIVEDCTKEQTFQPFTEKQRDVIKSMIALPLLNDSNESVAVIVADVNTTNYFQREKLNAFFLNMLREELSLRLQFELDMAKLLV